MIRKPKDMLAWQSKAVLLLVLPVTAVSVLLQGHWWATQVPEVAWTALGISVLFALVVWKLKAGTPRAAATGALITASLMFSTTHFPYRNSWAHGAILPLLTVFLLTFVATKLGKRKKEALRLAEDHKGRNSAQVAANLGAAALFATALTDLVSPFGHLQHAASFAMVACSISLAEAAADTVSSEIGQAFGGQPRMLTNLRKAAPGTDGAITLVGTVAGICAACLVACAAAAAGQGSWFLFGWIVLGAVFGLFVDSLLGATLERLGWLNNDAVNFLSTLSAPLGTLLGVWLGSLVSGLL